MRQLFLQGKDITELSDTRLDEMIRYYKKLVETSWVNWNNATTKNKEYRHEAIRIDAERLVSAGLLEKQRRRWVS